MTDVEGDLGLLRGRLLQWLMNDALPIWWNVGADKTGGGFHEAIDHAGEPIIADRRARVQARQIFTYAVARDMGWSGPAHEAMTHGLDYFLGRYRRPDGMFCNALTVDGNQAAAAPYLYEQAFALLAMATAHGPENRMPELVPVAERLLERLLGERRGHAGGFTGFVDDAVYQSDPHMHLFETALAWEEISSDPRWSRLADELAELCLARFITKDGGILLEYFDSSWAPAAGDMGRLVWPGHQFEWAGLLERWALSRGREDVRKVARRLYRIGADHGIDAKRGVAVFELTDEMAVNDPKARLWAQAEWLKAAIILARFETDEATRLAYLADAAAGARSLLRFLEMPVGGLWRDKLTGEGEWIDEPAPASSFYHIIDSLRVLAAWQADPSKSGRPKA